MHRKKIVLVFGGCSPEYEVSLKSSYAVASSISGGKYELILLGITRTGRWYRYTGPLDRLPDDTWHLDPRHCRTAVLSPDRPGCLLEFSGGGVMKTGIDTVFPVLHGQNGEDGAIQGLCQLAGIPVIGCGTLSAALCMDKDRAHRLVAGAGIRVPKSVRLDSPPPASDLAVLTDGLPCPLFVKPLRAGSSIGVKKVACHSHLSAAVREAFRFDSAVIIEEGIDGFEVGCAVMGNDTLTIGRVDEIELADGFFDYTEKYTLKTSRIHMPARITPETEERIWDAAARIYRLLGCQGFARVDMFLTPDGEIVFNEVNTIPGFTPHSRFPNMMRGIGIGFEELVDRLIELGLDA
jgi:D-alanine---D-serine ligase